MQEATCCACGLSGPPRSFYSLNGKTYCEPCVWKASKQAAARNEPAEYVSLGYDTACARCGKDSGTVVLSKVGDAPFCAECQQVVYDWPYPQWLKASLAVLLVLLVVALVHGRKYFAAGNSLYRGEKLAELHDYERAVPYLKTTVDVAPQSDKGVLLYAIACLRTGKAELAMRAIQNHNGGRFEDSKDHLFIEAHELADRADRAYSKAEEASKLAANSGHDAEAAELMRQASEIYPENPNLTLAFISYDAGAAFEAKDYDRFVSRSEELVKRLPDSPDTLAMLSSALACKYAVTGDAAYKDRAEQLLQQAGKLSEGSPDAVKGFGEYSERIRYRLSSRNIIDKGEYDRRFRGAKAGQQ